MSSTQSILRTGVTALKKRTGLSMAKMMTGAKMGVEAIDTRYLAKLSSGAARSRTLETLRHLISQHGARPRELLQPMFVLRGAATDATVSIPETPYHGRMTQAEFEAGLQERDYKINDINDPLCDVLTVFARPEPGMNQFKVLGVGRGTLLAIEAGLNTPEALEVALANSPQDTISPLMQAIGEVSGDQSMTSSKTMSVYVPPDILVTCALITYARQIEFLGEPAIGHYAAAPAVSRARRPENPDFSGQTAKILTATEFPLPL